MPQRPSRDEALKLATTFYELDHELTNQERLELHDFYSKVWKSNISLLYLGFIPGMALPYALKYRKTGSIAGVNLFWAVFTGFAGMMVAPQVISPIYFKFKFSEFEMQKGESSKQVKIIETLPLFLAFKWAEYYKLSAEDDSRKLKDPREEPSETKERTPGFIASGDLLGIKRGTTYGGYTQQQQGIDHPVNTWENVRKGNGSPLPTGRLIPAADSKPGDIFEDEFTYSETDSDIERQQSSSSWDSIRRAAISGNGNLIGKPSYQNKTFSNDDTKTDQEKFEEMLESERNATD